LNRLDFVCGFGRFTANAKVVKAKTTPKSNLPTHGLFGEIFFDVPVYRLTKKDYESRQEKYVQDVMCEGGPYAQEMYRLDTDIDQRTKGHLRLTYGGPWLFNEIIGFIRLYFYFTQIRGEYWRIDTKKIFRSRRKVFVFREWKVTYEEEIPPGSSSDEIFELLMKYLMRAQTELKNRYVDVSVFTRIGPCVDWIALFADSLKNPARKRANG